MITHRTFVDIVPVTPHGTRPTAHDPLVRSATADELHTTTVVDPVVGDTVTCTELQARDRDCWREADQRWPPQYAYGLDAAERERAYAARGICRRRRWALLRVCRVGGVRAG